MGQVHHVAFSPDGTRFVTRECRGTAKVWNAHTGALVLEIKGAGEVNAVAFSPDGTRMLTASGDSAVTVWERGRAPPSSG